MSCKYNVSICANIFPQNVWETWTVYDHASLQPSLYSLNWEPKKQQIKGVVTVFLHILCFFWWYFIQFKWYFNRGSWADFSESPSGWCPMNTWENTCMADAEKNHCLCHFWSLEIPLLFPERLCQSWCPDESPVWIITSCPPKFPIWSIFQLLP